MDTLTRRPLTQSAQTAKAIRNLLKTKYPTIKFNVTSKNYAGGDSVNVAWNLGPCSKKIQTLIDDFQYGHFNGMDDIYEYSNTRKDIPQAKYVHTSRDYYTAEEIENYKIDWRSPLRKDLYKEEKTLYHQIGRDLCAAAGIEYQGLNTWVKNEQAHFRCVRGDVNMLQDCIYQLVQDTDFMDGYHGVTNAISAYDRDSGRHIGWYSPAQVKEIGFKSDNTVLEKCVNVFVAY